MYKCKHCGKEFDDKRKLAGHSTHCKLNPKYEHNMECLAEARTHVQKHRNGEFNKEEIQHCQYCGKECHSKNSLLNHERLCKFNPNRVESNLKNLTHKGHKAWNKGLTVETDERVKKQVEKMVKRVENGELNFYKVKRYIYEYNGVKLDGSWELMFAIYLDEHNIVWERPRSVFTYFFNGKEHKYLPDFYLPNSDLYIEIKGQPCDKDYAKWEWLIEKHCKKLNVYIGNDLVELGLKVNNNHKITVPDKFKQKHKLK